MNNIGAIILAAGKGKRMNSKDVNKVVLHLGKKPMILHTFSILKKLKIKRIIIVVGFAKNSVIDLFKNSEVIFSEQKKRLGTAHAVSVAMQKIPKGIDNVLVLNGDDSAFYNPEIIKKVIEKHVKSDASFTFLTIEMNNPAGLGRIVRDENGKVKKIVEHKDATEEILKIKEINPACYVFKVKFLKKYLPKVKKSSVTGEYYLISLVDVGIKNNEKIETLQIGHSTWRGVNTMEELREAENMFLKLK